jgi:hypothetical protein
MLHLVNTTNGKKLQNIKNKMIVIQELLVKGTGETTCTKKDKIIVNYIYKRRFAIQVIPNETCKIYSH